MFVYQKLCPKIHLKLFKGTKLMILIEGIKYIVKY